MDFSDIFSGKAFGSFKQQDKSLINPEASVETENIPNGRQSNSRQIFIRQSVNNVKSPAARQTNDGNTGPAPATGQRINGFCLHIQGNPLFLIVFAG